MSMRTALLITMLLALVPASALAQFYQHTDKSGNTVYTDEPQNADSRQKQLREDGVYSSSPQEERRPAAPAWNDPPADRGPAEEPKKKNYNRVNVALYMTDW